MAGVDVFSQPLKRLLDSAKERAASLPVLVPASFYLPAPPLYCPQPSPDTQVHQTRFKHVSSVALYCRVHLWISFYVGHSTISMSGSGEKLSLSGLQADAEGSHALQSRPQLSARCAVVHQEAASLQTSTTQGANSSAFTINMSSACSFTKYIFWVTRSGRRRLNRMLTSYQKD